VEKQDVIKYLEKHAKIDSKYGRDLFRVKRNLRSISALRAELISLAMVLHLNEETVAYLVLWNTHISTKRILLEFEAVRMSLRKEIAGRFRLLSLRGGEWSGHPTNPNQALIERVSKLVTTDVVSGIRLGKPDYFFEIVKLLVLRSFNLPILFGNENLTPVTRTWIEKTINCSYPTVAEGLRRLKRVITIHSDRRVKLKRFPSDAWAELLLTADRVRHTVRYADRSGQPRSIETLLRRLKKMSMQSVAVAGTFGARYWCPDLDLHGDPRLDLSVHCPTESLDLDFVQKLDPALGPVNDQAEPALLVIHSIRRAEKFFAISDEKDLLFADPVECLLDLYDLRFAEQAAFLAKSLSSLHKQGKLL